MTSQLQVDDAQSMASSSQAGAEPDIDLSELREVSFNPTEKQKKSFPDNVINNAKYTWFTFVPIVLFNQFKYFFNLFFLLIALSQIIPALRVGFLISFVAPLVFVLAVTMIKEFFDDAARKTKDAEVNSQEYLKVDIARGEVVPCDASNFSVGDFILLKPNERAPADLVLLQTTDKEGQVFIRTDQLDGETDWKVRRPMSTTQKAIESVSDVPNFSGAHIYAEHPNQEIYDFAGMFILGDMKEPLSLENTMWQNTILASNQPTIGIVVYTGKDTRFVMNIRQASTKCCLLDEEVNYLSKILFCFLLGLSFLITALNGFHGHWQMFFFRIMLLMSSIIPISVRINLDLAKLYYCHGINNDADIPGVIARNSNIPEELGRIQFLISDKTGTLTQNDMITRKIYTEYSQFSYKDNKQEMVEAIGKSCYNYPKGVAADYYESGGEMKCKRREEEQVLRDMLAALALCNNVTPVVAAEPLPQDKLTPAQIRAQEEARIQAAMSTEDEEPQLEASSPDEVSLVKFGYLMKMALIERQRKDCTMRDINGNLEKFEILASFPFTSESKKMACLIKSQSTGNFIYYLKGAEVVIQEKIRPTAVSSLLESCESLAMDGLRTLAFAQKILTPTEADNFMTKLRKAEAKLKNREQAILAVQARYEINMEFLGVTGVEDKLQNNVEGTIESLKAAGIQVWMLTGDKVETATNIAISTGLKGKKDFLFFMREIKTPMEFLRKIDELHKKEEMTTVIIDGKSLSVVLNDQECMDRFFYSVIRAPCVCVCRCSPTQKAEIARALKFYTEGKKICGIGDGGNDVGMILESDVGVGIEGKEGMQASLAADFSLVEFSQLRKLVLWHGRLSYKRSAILSQFVFHRGLIISIIQALFTIMFFFVAIPIYNGMLMLGYATVYTALPVFSLVLDTDANKQSVLKFPPLYKTLQKGRLLNVKTFSIWIWKSIYQGSVIILFAIIMFNDSYVNIVTITFSALICIEILNVYTQIHNYTTQMFYIQVFTAVSYFMSIIFMKYYFQTSYIDEIFCIKIAIITLITWGPIQIAYFAYQYMFPDELATVMMDAQYDD